MAPGPHPPAAPSACLLFLFLFILTPFPLRAQDTVVLKNGRKAACRVLDFTAGAVKISYSATPGAAPADRLVPLGEVEYVELAPLPGEAEALALAVREGRSEPLIGFWVKRLPWIGHPRTNGGETGLTYAELLTRVTTPDRMERALKIYQQIEAADWSAERRGRAQAGRLRVMLRQGRTAEVRPQAEALLQQSGDPRVLIELRHVMAEASAAALTQLEKDHPRWQQEDELGPRHEQFLNDALDGYLYPHLFHGAGEDLAARGLWAAAQLSASQKQTAQATAWSTDLTQLYASTPEAAAAKTWLEQHPVPAPAPQPRTKPAAEPGTTNEDGEAEAAVSGSESDESKPEVKSRTRPKTGKKPPPPSKTKPTATAEEGPDE